METASCCVQSPQTPIRRLQQDPLFLGLGMASPPQWEGKIVTFNRSLLHTAKSLQSCLTLCNPIDGSPPGSPIPGILQARTLEWVAVSFSNAWKRKAKVKSFSCVWLLTPRTVAYHAPPSMGFPRQEYWSGVPLPSPIAIIGFHNNFSSKHLT